LDVDTEVKLLRVLHNCKQKTPMDIVATYCGAHSVPKGKTALEATENIINIQLSTLKVIPTNCSNSEHFVDHSSL
jgi:imidazolonepropionase